MLAVGLIHMNGRLYDPLLHRFLSPDNYVQDPTNSQNFNRYGYVLNNPLSHVDPSGEIIPLLVFVGAAIIGGGANVWSNWDKIVKNPWSAVSYFASGAVGGAVSVVNPWLGGSITGVANIGVDAAYGNIPKFSGFKDVAKYLGGKVLDGLGAAGAGGISKWGYNLAGKLGWIQTGAFNATSFLVGAGTEGVASSVTAPEFILKNTRTTILEPLLETGANTAKGLGNIFPKTESVIGHVFRDAAGHVNPTTIASQNRYINLFESVGNNLDNINPNVLNNFQLSTKGFQGFSQVFRNGKQVWVQTINGKIFDAGVNIIPK